MDSMIKSTPLTSKHTKLGAKMTPFAGFLMPVQYTSIKEEHMAVRKAAGLFDVCHMGEFIIEGSRSTDFLQFVTSNDVSKLNPGQAQYSCLPSDEGGIVDDLIVYRMHSDEEEPKYMLVVNASNMEKDWNWLTGVNRHFGVKMNDISDTSGLLALQGPRASAILQEMTEVDLSKIDFYHHTKGTVAGIDGVIISATGYTGSGGFELYVPNENIIKLWDTILENGKKNGLLPAGLGCRDTLRLEMGYCLYGNDLDDHTSPIEAGLSWITKTRKAGFICRDIFVRQKKEGVSRKLMGFVVEDRRVARQGYDILDESENIIGKVTSGGLSPILEQPIGLGYMPTDYQEEGRRVLIDTGRKKLTAITKKAPFIEI